jgi:hypothetical protein
MANIWIPDFSGMTEEFESFQPELARLVPAYDFLSGAPRAAP